MQITLNKVPFDLAPVDGSLRAALLADPTVAGAVRRDVWAWDREAGEGRFLVPVTQTKGLPLPTGMTVFVPRPGPVGIAPVKAEGPTRKMADRFLQGVGAKTFPQVMQALARVLGIPQKTLPFEAFAALNPLASYRIRAETEFAVVEMANAARNLRAFAFVPGLVVFSHVAENLPEGAPAPGTIRPGFVLPPATQAAQVIRRLAVVKRLNELQAELGGTKPADLPPGDPRRDVVARLGAEWRALQPKAKAA